MANSIENNVEEINPKQEFISDADQEALADLVNHQESLGVLTQSLEDPKTMKEIQDIVPELNTRKDEQNKETKEVIQVNVEKSEIIGLKKDLFEHFTINGKSINRATDISNNIISKNNGYTVAIQWYTGLQFRYETGDKKKQLILEENKGGIRKWLFLYDVDTQAVDTEGNTNKEITPKFNSTKTIEAINKQLEKNDKDGDKKGDYKVRSIDGTSITFEYGVNFIKDKTDENKTKSDTFTLKVDANNNIVLPDSQEVGQVSQRKKITWTIKKDTDVVFDEKYKTEKWSKIIYYAQTKVNDNGIPELILVNNIQKWVPGAFESIYAEHQEMTNRQFKDVKEDFLTNKIERIFNGTLNKNHESDFQNNWKITQAEGNGKNYNFEITFNKNDGKQQKVNIPFKMTIESSNNTRKYVFPDNNKYSPVMIDNVVYDINTPKNADEVPSIKMIESQEKTLKNAEIGTSNKVNSDIFSGETKNRENDEGNKYTVKSPAFSLGDIEFDGKWGYKRTLLFGEQKDGKKNILLSWEEKGTVYYDQDYKIIHIDIKKNGKEVELDLTNPAIKVNIENTLEDEEGTKKSVLLTPKIVQGSLQLNFQAPWAKETNTYRQSTDLYLERIRAEKETIFTALKKLSKTFSSDIFTIPTNNTKDEVSYATQKIVGPDGQGLYKRKIVGAVEGKGKRNYLEQSIYCKVEGESLSLCDSDGNVLENTYLIDPTNEHYYKLTVDGSNPKNFSVEHLGEAEPNNIIKLETEIKAYDNKKVSIDLQDDTIELLKSNLKDRYTFANKKHEMCTIYLDNEKKIDSKTLEWGNQKPQIIKTGDAWFGSYKKYFAGNGRENLGIDEAQYEAVFKGIYGGKYTETDSNKKIIQVKLRSSTDNKYYYDYMAIKQKGTRFVLESLKGIESAKAEMKWRLDNLVLLNNIKISTKWDKLRGVKINNKDTPSRMAYLNDKNSPVKITLTDTTNKTTEPIEITMGDKGKWTLAKNTDITLWDQKINCTLEFENDIPYVKIDIIKKDKQK